MTDLKSPVSRRTAAEHSRYKRRIIATLVPGDVVQFRLERARQTYSLPLEKVFDIAESTHARALSNI